jgi:hypothetical protein
LPANSDSTSDLFCNVLFLRCFRLAFVFITDHRLEKCCVRASRHRVWTTKRLPARANRLQHHVIELGLFRFKRANGLIVYNFGAHLPILAEKPCAGEEMREGLVNRGVSHHFHQRWTARARAPLTNCAPVDAIASNRRNCVGFWQVFGALLYEDQTCITPVSCCL